MKFTFYVMSFLVNTAYKVKQKTNKEVIPAANKTVPGSVKAQI